MGEHVFVQKKHETQHLWQWKQKHLGSSQIGNNESISFLFLKRFLKSMLRKKNSIKIHEEYV
jgi:hypothetical protein